MSIRTPRRILILLLMMLPALAGTACDAQQPVGQRAGAAADPAPVASAGPPSAAAANRASQAPHDSAVMLQYHFVAEHTPRSTSVTPAEFAQHMAYLAEHDFTVLPLPELLERLRAGETLPPRSVAITFDDAYLSVYEEAFPILEARGWPFTVFVNTAAIDAPGRTFTSWAQLEEMQDSGATIANHSVSHAYLVRGDAAADRESDAAFRARMEAEIGAAEDRIEARLGVRHKLFAYPYGEYDDRVRDWVREHGYIGIGQHSGAIWSGSDFSALPRFPFSGDYAAMDQFVEKVRMAPMRVLEPETLPPQPLATKDARPRLEFRVTAGTIRADQLACYASGQGRIETEVDVAPGDGGGPGVVQVGTRAASPLPMGRSRYNCTAPQTTGGWAWFSHPWLRENPEGPTPP